MKLVTTASELETEFLRLLKHYKAFYWTAAWAGIDSPVYKELCLQETKIKQAIIGIHFYQTHPDFIERFLNAKSVKFIKQPEGTFHPKLYLFYDSDSKWELIIGSANFTKQAFSKNTEASFLITSKDSDSTQILKQTRKSVEDCWKNAVYFDKPELDDYRIMWAIQRPKIKSLSGKLGNSLTKPFHQISFMVMAWKQFVGKIKKEHNHTLKKRIDMLATARRLFIDNKHFKDFNFEERSFIAGIPYKNGYSAEFEDWGCFGSMMGAGTFKNKIRTNNKLVSEALDEIPLYGEVTEEHYNNYKNLFAEVFPGNGIATLSRLLAMKRPDIFYCITKANKKAFCKGYDVIYSHITYDSYWDLIVTKIVNSEWWLHPNPTSSKEAKISEARAAFVDAFCYQA